MIVVTGGCGFIGSNLIKKLNSLNKVNILIVDEINKNKKKNINNLRYLKIEKKNVFLDKLLKGKYHKKIDCIFHYGACSDTTKKNWKYLYKNNFLYSKKLIQYSIKNKIKIAYASSASVYGLDANDKKESSKNLQPINYYAKSKYLIDKYISKLNSKYVIGLRFFNVYGKNELHKKNMMSPITKFYLDIKNFKKCKIFDQYGGYKRGQHSRDFIFVEDCNNVALWLINNDKFGIFNVGRGKAITFKKVAQIIIDKLGGGEVEYVNFPKKLMKRYQTYTKANINKLLSSGYKKKFLTIRKSLDLIKF